MAPCEMASDIDNTRYIGTVDTLYTSYVYIRLCTVCYDYILFSHLSQMYDKIKIFGKSK